MSNKKYYWLKLKKDFFKRHDIKIVESMPNGKDYVLFYLKLLVESVDHDGELRFNETIPYNEQMLSTITNTNIDTVSNAMKLFRELGMVEILDDQTIYMNEVSKMLGAETYWAQKKREERQKNKLSNQNTPQIGHCPTNVQDESNVSNQEIEKDIDKELEKEKDTKKSKKKKPANADFTSVFSSYTSNEELIDALNAFVEMRKAIKKPPTERAMKLILNKLTKLSESDDQKIKILEQSILRNWIDIYDLKDEQQRGSLNAKTFRNNGEGIQKDPLGFEMV